QRLLIISATAIYVIGMLGVTIGGNVPMNEKLASMRADTAEAAEYWQIYLKVWTRWNHARTAASFIAAGLFLAVPLAG
ncbi:MAG: anthrone oxygenase family protein, partial [Pseudomonadota bacterium]